MVTKRRRARWGWLVFVAVCLFGVWQFAADAAPWSATFYAAFACAGGFLIGVLLAAPETDGRNS